MHSLFVTALLFPVIMLIVAYIVFKVTKQEAIAVRTGKELTNISIKYAAIGAGLTLIYTVAEMIWYKNTTGYGAGNGPLAWIFLFGPIGAAIGQLLALIKWRYGKAI